MKLKLQLSILCILLVALPTLANAFGNAADPSAGPAPKLDRDLAVTLHLPLFDPAVGETPVASLGEKTILLQELTPALEPTEDVLFWEWETSAADLSKQFKRALDARIEAEGGTTQQAVIYAEDRILEGQKLVIDAPLFAEIFAGVPVALIENDPITVAEFAQDLRSVHMEAEGDHAHSGAQANIQRLIERLVTVRLVEQEARNIGFDQTPSFRNQVAAFAEKTLLYGLLNTHAAKLKLDDEAVEDFYRQISLEGKIRTFRFDQKDDADRILEAYENSQDFEVLIADAVASGKAREDEQKGYLKFNELLPNIAKEAVQMEIGAVSQVFRQADGFVIFKLEDRRFVEDPNALAFATRTIGEEQRAKTGTKYVRDIVDRYAEYDESVRKTLDFSQMKQDRPDIQLTETLKPLLKDERVLVRVEGAQPSSLTVAAVAEKLKGLYFHGTDIPLNAKEADERTGDILEDLLFRMAGTLEAQKMGLNERPEYHREIEEFERRTLFDIFMQKVIVPDVRLTEEDLREYYDEHLEEYQTPAMFRLKSLPFYQKADALDAVEKLRSGSDFKWVSANVEGLATIQDEDLLQFDQNILSLSAMPQSLQSQVGDAERGDTVLFEGQDGFFYVLHVENVFPSEAKPFEQVREEILKLVYQEKTEEVLEEWVGKLKEAYKTRIFLAANNP